MSEHEKKPVERDELEEQEGEMLPEREAMSIIGDPLRAPGVVTPLPNEPSDLE